VSRPLCLEAAPPFRLGAVVLSHGWFQTAPFAWDEERERLERVEMLPAGPARLRVEPAPDGVVVTADRPLAAAERAELARRVRRMLQLDVDVGGFYASLGHEPRLAEDLARYGGGRLLAGTSLYEDVVKAICGTNILWRQAVLCIARIGAWGVGGAFPEPAALLAAGEDRLRAEARVGYRAPALLEAARAALDGTLDAIEADLPGLDGDALAARLRRLRGVGPSTAGFLCLLAGRFDRLVIDSATVRFAAEVWFEGRRPTPAEVAARVEPAGPWRGLALYWAMMRRWQLATGLVSG
jgi:3-methyladenine DNA glycosylase/8-oxoguanine DNA glycosylase